MVAVYRSEKHLPTKEAEIMGIMIAGYLHILDEHEINSILASYGLNPGEFDPEGWYPLELFQDIAEALHTKDGDEIVMGLKVGQAMSHYITYICCIDDAERFIECDLNDITASFTRNMPDEYGFEIKKIEPKHYYVESNLPLLPKAMIYGWILSTLRLLAKTRKNVIVKPLSGYYDDDDVRANFEIFCE